LTVVLCGAIGFEREVRDQPAGFRTHILLGLGATLFTLVSAYGFEPFTRAALGSGGLQFDPTRISAQIVTGVGFLGAGAIIRRGGDVRGLTTAASPWATAAIGMAVGAGYLFGAAATTALAMATLYALRSFRSSIIYPLLLDSAGLEITLKEPGSGPPGRARSPPAPRYHGPHDRRRDRRGARPLQAPGPHPPTPRRPPGPSRALRPPRSLPRLPHRPQGLRVKNWRSPVNASARTGRRV
ncbi:MAG TPA: MgtC/SapB family protein, partial [Rubrobacter sp.]|nr:MgtC/SapB family protein [Rubrobacter sp.]